jgi:hypothetical protein
MRKLLLLAATLSAPLLAATPEAKAFGWCDRGYGYSYGYVARPRVYGYYGYAPRVYGYYGYAPRYYRPRVYGAYFGFRPRVYGWRGWGWRGRRW